MKVKVESEHGWRVVSSNRVVPSGMLKKNRGLLKWGTGITEPGHLKKSAALYLYPIPFAGTFSRPEYPGHLPLHFVYSNDLKSEYSILFGNRLIDTPPFSLLGATSSLLDEHVIFSKMIAGHHLHHERLLSTSGR